MKIKLYKIPYFPGYFVTKCGKVYSKYSGKYKRLNPYRASGYLEICAVVYNIHIRIRVHRLLLLAFVGLPKPNQIARHLDGNKLNNSLDNICWGTLKENQNDRKLHGTSNVGSRHGRAIINEEIARLIKMDLYKYNHKFISKKYGVAIHIIKNISCGKTWKHVKCK